MQFMASIAFDPSYRDDILREMPAEQARVRELQQQGLLETLYVPDGNTGPTDVWVVFNGDSRDLVDHVIESLPLYPYMQVELTPLLDLRQQARG